MKSATRKLSASSHGSVLIVVLVVCLGLVSLTLVFGHSMLLAYRGADNDLAGRQADQAIEGAARYAQSLLVTGTAGQFPDPANYQSEAVPIGDAQFWFISPQSDTEAGDTVAFGLVDEASKLNINAANVDMLQGLPGVTPEMAAAIIDWRDANETPSANGAESETYMLRQPGYGSKSAPFESEGELALVNGADMDILFGEDTNLNGVLDPNEDDGSKSQPSDNSDGKLDAGILDYVTAFTREPNKRSDGTARINIGNLAQLPQEFTTLLSGTLGTTRAPQIQQSLQAARPRTVVSTLEFFAASGMTEEEFDKIADAITVSNAPYIIGLVNVNTASETVLACIPGIGTDKAASLVAARANRATPATSVAWVAPILADRDSIRSAGPYLTTRSFQVSADIAAVGRHGRGYRRTRFVIDTTGDAPKVVYRRNLAPLGWALGSETRQTIATAKEEDR